MASVPYISVEPVGPVSRKLSVLAVFVPVIVVGDAVSLGPVLEEHRRIHSHRASGAHPASRVAGPVFSLPPSHDLFEVSVWFQYICSSVFHSSSIVSDGFPMVSKWLPYCALVASQWFSCGFAVCLLVHAYSLILASNAFCALVFPGGALNCSAVLQSFPCVVYGHQIANYVVSIVSQWCQKASRKSPQDAPMVAKHCPLGFTMSCHGFLCVVG